jgi:hypothetical protein
MSTRSFDFAAPSDRQRWTDSRATITSTPPIPEIASSRLTPTVFHERWWLDAVTGGDYREASVRSGNKVIGRLPYQCRRYAGMTECILPQLTPLLGPAIDDGDGRETVRRQIQRTVTLDLLDQIPACSRFRQRLHGGIPDTLAFLERGFRTETEFTHLVAPAPVDQLWKNVRDTTRRVIRRAGDQGRILDLDPGDFTRLYIANLRGRGKSYNYMWQSSIQPALRDAIDRDRGRLLGAEDATGKIVAAIFTLCDDRVTHLVLTTRSPDSHSGQISKLIWQAMKSSAEQGRTFDFGGVNTAGSAFFYANFGGFTQPRYLVHKETSVFNLLDFSRRKLLSLRGRMAALI